MNSPLTLTPRHLSPRPNNFKIPKAITISAHFLRVFSLWLRSSVIYYSLRCIDLSIRCEIVRLHHNFYLSGLPDNSGLNHRRSEFISFNSDFVSPAFGYHCRLEHNNNPDIPDFMSAWIHGWTCRHTQPALHNYRNLFRLVVQLLGSRLGSP